MVHGRDAPCFCWENATVQFASPGLNSYCYEDIARSYRIQKSTWRLVSILLVLAILNLINIKLVSSSHLLHVLGVKETVVGVLALLLCLG